MALLAALLLSLVPPVQPAPPEVDSPCQVHVILFVPAGVEPAPAACQKRIDEIVDYAERFLGRGLRRWGHEGAILPFRRTAQGHVEVEMMRGKEPTASYKPVPLRAEVMNALRAQGRITRARQIWWIFVYAGEPPERFDGFLGGYGEDIGGWAVCNLDTTRGRINPTAPLSGDFLAELMLKGMLHELGHGFGLPHVGPLDADDAVNTLMGPTERNWRRVRDPEKRVYLSEAEAAILSQRPAFRGAADLRGPLPKPEVQDLTYSVDRRRKTIVVRGRVRSTRRVVYALVGDESADRPWPEDYWVKTYVGAVAEDGSFEVMVTEPAAAAGVLKTWFVFEGGDHTGDGKKRGRDGAIAQPYTYEGGRWIFDPV
jgi:hypothetical protein